MFALIVLGDDRVIRANRDFSDKIHTPKRRWSA